MFYSTGSIVPYIANHSRLQHADLNCNLLEKLLRLDISLVQLNPIVQAISLESYAVTDRFAKIFHHE